MRISTLRHPQYTDNAYDFNRWRLCAKGGRHFIDFFLRRFNRRETHQDFEDRRFISYAPSFAKAALNKLKNTFYSRMSEIQRSGGPQSYIDAIEGLIGGVDRYGGSMNKFIGSEVLFELMAMRRVGVYVDREPNIGPTKAQLAGSSPYLYHYKTEDILTWDYTFQDGEYIYKNVLLRDYDYTYDNDSGMVEGVTCRYRQVWRDEKEDNVKVQFWLENRDVNATEDIPDGDVIVLDLRRIPFVFAGLQESLLNDVCDYQVALLNIASADINYVFKANFPFYTEEYDPAAENVYQRRPIPGPAQKKVPINPDDGTEMSVEDSDTDRTQINVGTMQGRRFPKGAKPPQFIAPPTEPLKASIEKQEQMKAEILQLIDLAAAQAKPMHASAESKQLDDRGLESGLSYIGLELEYLEREIAKIWAEYEGGEPANIKYPIKYTLKSDKDRVEEATALDKLKLSAPSKTYSKEVAKQVVQVMLADKVPTETIEKINQEIDEANYTTGDPNTINIAMQNGLADAKTASDALGFDGATAVPLAQKEHAARLALVQASQSPNNAAARGNDDKAPVQGKDKLAKDGNTIPVPESA